MDSLGLVRKRAYKAKNISSWVSLISILGIIILLLLKFWVFEKEDSGKTVAKWGETEKEMPVEHEDVLKVYHVTYETEPTDSSYWFVQLEFVREGGGKTTIHSAVALPMPYFDFELARKEYDRKGECYFEYFKQITKEGYESFYKYAGENE
jgi:hypothetical protein